MSQFLSQHSILAPILYIVARSFAIIIPPIPGLAIDVVGLVAFGWVWALVYTEIAVMCGAMVAFWVARKFREPVVQYIAPLEKINEWADTLSEKNKFWLLVAIRLPTNALFDYLSYAAGLTRIGAWKFFFSTLIGNIPGIFIVFYFGGMLYQKGVYMIGVFLVAAFILGFIFKGKIVKYVSEKMI